LTPSGEGRRKKAGRFSSSMTVICLVDGSRDVAVDQYVAEHWRGGGGDLK
jgi:hypothetical protein